MKKISKTKTGTTSTLDFYDQLTKKQREKFDNKRDSFTIDFCEIENIYNFLVDKQTRTLILSVGMFAATGKVNEIEATVLADLSGDPLTLAIFNSMALRVKNHTKSWLNGRGEKKEKTTENIEDDSAETESDTIQTNKQAEETFEGKEWETIKRMAEAMGIDSEWYEMDLKYNIAETSTNSEKTPLEVAPDILADWKEQNG